MADLFARDTWLVLSIISCAVLIVLPIQLVLCFRAKKLFIKRLPTAVLTVVAIAFYVLAITAKTWIAFIYLIIAVFSGVSLIFCGIAWGIWSILKLINTEIRDSSS